MRPVGHTLVGIRRYAIRDIFTDIPSDMTPEEYAKEEASYADLVYGEHIYSFTPFAESWLAPVFCNKHRSHNTFQRFSTVLWRQNTV